MRLERSGGNRHRNDAALRSVGERWSTSDLPSANRKELKRLLDEKAATEGELAKLRPFLRTLVNAASSKPLEFVLDTYAVLAALGDEKRLEQLEPQCPICLGPLGEQADSSGRPGGIALNACAHLFCKAPAATASSTPAALALLFDTSRASPRSASSATSTPAWPATARRRRRALPAASRSDKTR